MKKLLSLFMATAMLVSSLAMSGSVFALAYPELKLDSPAKITMVKKGEEEAKLAKFSPEKSGSYVFECASPYTNTASKDEFPGGAIGIDLVEDDATSTQGFCFFFDFTNVSPEIKTALEEYFKELGGDINNANIIKFTAELEAGKTYYITGYQDGNSDFTTEISVKEHTHTIKKNVEEKVKVKKDGTSDDIGGIYDECTDWFCTYQKYKTTYYQIEKTTVKNAVYTGKAVKPAVKIKTSSGKNLSSKYYTVTYKNNKKIGKGKAVIKFRNGYTGTVTKTFKINPKATTLKKTKAGKKQLKAIYKKGSNVSGYQVQVATNAKFTKNKKTVTVKGAKKTSAIVKGLKGGKKYYVRVRTFKTVDGKKYYSSWSDSKKATVKK